MATKKNTCEQQGWITFYFSSMRVELYLGLAERVESERSSLLTVRGEDRPLPVPSFSLSSRLASSALLVALLELAEFLTNIASHHVLSRQGGRRRVKYFLAFLIK